MSAILRVEPGIRPQGVLTAELELPSSRYSERPKVAGFYRELTAGLATLPGVTAVGTSSFLPLTGRQYTLSVKFLDHPVAAGDEASIEYRVAGGNFFAAAGIPILRAAVHASETTPARRPSIQRGLA
jgi:hypothetical protein